MTSVELPEQVGRYRILSELGRGSMGRVFLALDPRLDRKIALKVMAPLQVGDPDEGAELERRFLNEARAAGRLHHPGIVMVLDADTDPGSGSSYLAMERVEGRSLQSLLRESERLPVATMVDLAAQVARALDHAHRAGVVHRDVKPGNVLVTPDGKAKVTDFGIAKVASQSMTLTGHILGSPYYMSPEQVQGSEMDGRTDLFSLGSILYQAVTGELPFGGDTLASVTYKVVNVDPRPVRSHGPDVPASLEAVIERALEKDPDRRFQTAAEMAEALEAVGRELQGEVGYPSRSAPEPGTPTGPAVGSPDRERSGPGTGTAVVDSGALAASASDEDSHEVPGATVSRRVLMLGACGLVCLLVLGFLASRPHQPPTPTLVPMPEVGDLVPDDPAAEAIEIPDTVEPPPIPSAKLGILYVHRLGPALITLSVDGEPAWSRQMDRPGGFFKRFSGRKLESAIPVTPGPHSIEVRIAGEPQGIDLREVIQGSFREGEVRWLRVGLNPVTKNLKLSWIE